ncbi:hypothetical protein, partial [Xanthovirga aplysinae]|uniref:hypothetical protein n=1 Tax=Xanthovirga aplysinae TaxID=2529853 RepID=UPI001656E1F9
KAKRKREQEMGNIDREKGPVMEEPERRERSMGFEDWMEQLEVEETREEVLENISYKEVKPSFVMEERLKAEKRQVEVKDEIEKVEVVEPEAREEALVFKPFSSFGDEERKSTEILEKIRDNPDWAKEAVIMSEIIHRKY